MRLRSATCRSFLGCGSASKARPASRWLALAAEGVAFACLARGLQKLPTTFLEVVVAKPFKEWTVLPHGPLERLDENIMTVTGKLSMPPMGQVDRRMTVVRVRGERLVIYSAFALGEPQMKVLEAFGKPSFLVVPNDIHRMDARIWKERYPELEVIAPDAARDKVGKVVRVDESEADFR